MKPLEKHSKTAADECAASVVDVALLVMRLMRAEIRRSRPADLSLNQVRALAVVAKTPEVSLSRVADTLGLALPSTSQLVDGLVRRGLLERRPGATDRRRLRLTLTPKGRRALDRALTAVRRHVAGRLAPLTRAERAAVIATMTRLRPTLAEPGDRTLP